MEFKLNQKDALELQKLMETNENNYAINDMYLYYYYNLARSIKKNDIEAMKKINHLDTLDAFFYSFINLLEIDISDPASLEEARRVILSEMKELKIEDYQNNPYLKNVKFNASKMNNIKISYDSYLPYEGFPSDDLKVDEDHYFEEHYSLGFFKEKYNFQSLTHDKITWMSIIPNEIETMKDDIDKVSGNVLVYGLGLGYFAYMISLKEDVKSITIVERDPHIIKLFKEMILPQFEHLEKIKIIEQDAFDFERTNQDTFDFAYVDLYHGSDDGIEIYLKFKALERRSSHYLYWLEDSLVNVIRRNIITLFYEKLEGIESDYNKETCFNDQIINGLFKIFKNKTFSSYQEIKDLLRKESLIKLVKDNRII